MDFIRENWQLIMPVIILQIILQAFCIVDLVRRPRVTGGNKLIWGVVIVVGELLGPVVYLGFGRKD